MKKLRHTMKTLKMIQNKVFHESSPKTIAKPILLETTIRKGKIKVKKDV